MFRKIFFLLRPLAPQSAQNIIDGLNALDPSLPVPIATLIQWLGPENKYGGFDFGEAVYEWRFLNLCVEAYTKSDYLMEVHVHTCSIVGLLAPKVTSSLIWRRPEP